MAILKTLTKLIIWKGSRNWINVGPSEQSSKETTLKNKRVCRQNFVSFQSHTSWPTLVNVHFSNIMGYIDKNRHHKNFCNCSISQTHITNGCRTILKLLFSSLSEVSRPYWPTPLDYANCYPMIPFMFREEEERLPQSKTEIA